MKYFAIVSLLSLSACGSGFKGLPGVSLGNSLSELKPSSTNQLTTATNYSSTEPSSSESSSSSSKSSSSSLSSSSSSSISGSVVVSSSSSSSASIGATSLSSSSSSVAKSSSSSSTSTASSSSSSAGNTSALPVSKTEGSSSSSSSVMSSSSSSVASVPATVNHLIPELNSGNFNNSVINSAPIDTVLDVSKAWTFGPWSQSTSIPGFYSSHYLFAKQDSSYKSTLTWYFSTKTPGFYHIYEHHTAYSNRTNNAKYEIVDTSTKKSIQVGVNQQINNAEWVKVATLWVREDGGAFTVSLGNAINPDSNGTSIDSGVVVADAVRFTLVSGKKYTVSGVEGSTVSMKCPTGQSPDFVSGHYYDSQDQTKRCVFYQQNFAGSNNILIENYLCGDPSWGHQKTGILEYRCIDSN